MRELSYSDLADFSLEEQEDLVIFVHPVILFQLQK